LTNSKFVFIIGVGIDLAVWGIGEENHNMAIQKVRDEF
jgi:hypothetical protein